MDGVARGDGQRSVAHHRDEGLWRHTAGFPPLAGMTRPEFDRLPGRLACAEADLRAGSDATRRGGKPRRRAAGAGHPCSHGAADRLLMALLWPGAFPTYEALGFFFAFHTHNARLNTPTLEVLDALSAIPLAPWPRPQETAIRRRGDGRVPAGARHPRSQGAARQQAARR